MANLTPRLDKLDTNCIINGGLDFWQRGTSFTLAVTGADGVASTFLADRFKAAIGRNGTDISVGLSKQTDVPQGGFVSSSLRATNNTATNLGSSGYFAPLYQVLEGNSLREIGYSDNVYVSSWVKTNWSGSLACSLEIIGSEFRTYTWLETVVANEWKRIYKKLTLPGYAFSKGNSSGAVLLIGGLLGTNYPSALETWQVGSSKYSHPTATQWIATAGNYVQITAVKISKFEHHEFSNAGRNYAEELQLCQRYYQRDFREKSPTGAYHTSALAMRWSLHTEMRSLPTVSLIAGTSLTNCLDKLGTGIYTPTGITYIIGKSPNSIAVDFSGSFTTYQPVSLYTDIIQADAEL